MRLRLTWLAAGVAIVAALVTAPAHASAQTGSTPPAAKPDTTGPHVHLRVLGLYDEQTGDPVEGADVMDVSTGISSRTTVTGTVALVLGDTTGTMIRIKKVGYQPVSMLIGTALSDTTPITTTILRAGVSLPAVITIGDHTIRLGAGDTISTLLRNGFYERRETSAAPRSAFISGDKLRSTAVISNARFFGRPICDNNVWIDGVKMTVPRRTGHFMKEGVDALVDPSDVAGIETYSSAELPVGTNHTMEGAGSLDVNGVAGAAAVNGGNMASVAGALAGKGCVTMIWLNR